MNSTLVTVILVIIVLVVVLIVFNLRAMQKLPDSDPHANETPVPSKAQGLVVNASNEALHADGAKAPEMNVEVMDGLSPKSVFRRAEHPFVLSEASVPALSEPTWQRMFYALTENRHVLGWIAFEGDKVGAADHEYEMSFIDVLRGYRRMVGKLQKEIGLSAVTETSIVGDEGRVWVLTVYEDSWIALFVDEEVDVAEITAAYLPQLRVTGNAPE